MRAVTLFIGAILFSGCATLFMGTTQRITVTSIPDGAGVWANGEYHGRTPVKIRLERKYDYELRLEKPGYVTETRRVTSAHWAGGTTLSIFLGGPASYGIDSGTGANKHLEPSEVEVRLTPK